MSSYILLKQAQNRLLRPEGTSRISILPRKPRCGRLRFKHSSCSHNSINNSASLVSPFSSTVNHHPPSKRCPASLFRLIELLTPGRMDGTATDGRILHPGVENDELHFLHNYCQLMLNMAPSGSGSKINLSPSLWSNYIYDYEAWMPWPMAMDASGPEGYDTGFALAAAAASNSVEFPLPFLAMIV